MRIVYHIGAHCTGGERLIRCLLKNRAVLAGERIAVPSPTRYRLLMRDVAHQLRGGYASQDQEALILDQIVEEGEPDRIVLSWERFLGQQPWLMRGALYGSGGERLRDMTRIFPWQEAEFHLSIRNPATFLPALQELANAKGTINILEDTDPRQLNWSDLVANIQTHNPGVPLTVWCDEETPLIWPEVLKAVAGHGPDTELVEADDLLAEIMSDIGFAKLKTYCAEHPPQSVAQRRRIVTAFLEKFAMADSVEVEIDMPGWTDDDVTLLTENYLADVERIRRMPGVTLVTS